ncbi:MAG TPA: AraC family transcriptional regulator, partial [Bacteroidia bacterium]
MVSLRCIMMVKAELSRLEIEDISIDLGIVITKEEIEPKKLELLKTNLVKSGLELLDDKKSILI